MSFPGRFGFLYGSIGILLLPGCQKEKSLSLRCVVDTVGFAHQTWQMDSIVKRIEAKQSDLLRMVKSRDNSGCLRRLSIILT